MPYGSTTPVISAAHHTSVDKCASIVPTPKDTNIVNTIKRLKEEGLWIAAADMDGETFYKQNLTGPLGVVIGSEGFGIKVRK